jgi:NodT family efflux transporter outer membrane factor (OMF) lipoprotein
MNRTAALLLLLALAGCRVGPDFSPPPASPLANYDLAALPADERVAAGGPALTPAEPAPDRWWQLFRCPALDATEAMALSDNNTLAAAKASLRQAEQVVAGAASAWWPQLDLGGGVQRNGAGGFTPAGGGTSSNFFSIGPSASYMADLFGGTARSVEQSEALADYQRSQIDAAVLTLTGGVATQAIAVAGARLQIATLEAILASDQQNLTLVTRQFDIGKAARSDVLTAQSQLVGDQSQLAQLRQQLSVGRHALAVLVSRAPADWAPPEFTIADFTLPPALPLALPSELRSRPDIRAALAQLHADSAAIGVASAQYYPSISLSAAVTQQSVTLGQLFAGSNNLWNVGASFTTPIFHGGALDAQKQAAVEAYQAQLATYQQTVIVAFGQVADSLRALEHDAEQVRAAEAALQISQASLALQRSSYQVGKASLLQLLTAQRAVAAAQQTSASARTQQLSDVVQFFLAVGSGIASEART